MTLHIFYVLFAQGDLWGAFSLMLESPNSQKETRDKGEVAGQ